MAAKKATLQEWTDYLALYKELSDSLAQQPWFAAGWETRYNYLNKDNPGGVWLQLIKKHWFDGAIHLETWINNPILERRAIPVVLHIETSKEKHGLSRNDFSKLFLERCGDLIQSWDGYTLKPNYPMEPFNTQAAFTKETLVSTLETELTRLQQLGGVIDQTIADVKK